MFVKQTIINKEQFKNLFQIVQLNAFINAKTKECVEAI